MIKPGLSKKLSVLLGADFEFKALAEKEARVLHVGGKKVWKSPIRKYSTISLVYIVENRVLLLGENFVARSGNIDWALRMAQSEQPLAGGRPNPNANWYSGWSVNNWLEVWWSNGRCDPYAPMPKAGWYWWNSFPGCLPDGDPYGPHPTSLDAVLDAVGGDEFLIL